MHDIIIRYLKVGCGLLFGGATLGIILYKLVSAPIAFDVQTLQTSDILSILLAIFSVALSVMFYFKSTEESSRFYNNSYQFTKEMSELLGRIESGFGERLKHIDEGYSSIGRRLEDVIAQKGVTKEKLKEEEQEFKEASKERDQLISTLLAKANISEEERNKFKTELEEKEKELNYARRQALRYRSQLKELDREDAENVRIPRELHDTLAYIAKEIGPEHLLRAPTSWLNRRLKEHYVSLPDRVIIDLRNHALIDSDQELTEKGRSLLKKWAASNT